MAETTNYGLYLEDDSTTKFQEWREKMNGSSDSNMVKIDAVLFEKADNSKQIFGTLLATSWNGSQVPYKQDIIVTGLSDEQNGIITMAPEATQEQLEIATSAKLLAIEQSNERLTVAAYGDLPTVDIPVVIILLG